MMIDRSKLRADVKRLAKGASAVRPAAITAVIRDLLPDIERMRSEDGASWRLIAEALAGQGLSEGAGKKPLSERRLTSIITKLKAQDKAKAKDAAARAGRSDVASHVAMTTNNDAKATKLKARLAPELTSQPPAPEEEPPLSEDDIRRSQRVKHAHLVRKE